MGCMRPLRFSRNNVRAMKSYVSLVRLEKLSLLVLAVPGNSLAGFLK